MYNTGFLPTSVSLLRMSPSIIINIYRNRRNQVIDFLDIQKCLSLTFYVYSAFNVITAPKELKIFQETGHWTFPEQTEALNNWLFKQLKGQ